MAPGLPGSWRWPSKVALVMSTSTSRVNLHQIHRSVVEDTVQFTFISASAPAVLSFITIRLYACSFIIISYKQFPYYMYCHVSQHSSIHVFMGHEEETLRPSLCMLFSPGTGWMHDCAIVHGRRKVPPSCSYNLFKISTEEIVYMKPLQLVLSNFAPSHAEMREC